MKRFLEWKIKKLREETDEAVISHKLERIFAYKEMAEVLTDTRIDIDGDKVVFED